ncbi:MAG: zinc ribbon domain-containing protein [Clostridia bacterium]|nr:zinc ribbon domain-containing protein [Clostridia bacterium]
MEDGAKCIKCGSELISGARFCPRCGADQSVITVPEEKTEIVCKNCGTILSETQKFCHICGSKSPKKRTKKEMKEIILNWTKRSLSLVLSIFFLIFAFLPVITISSDDKYSEKYDVDVSISAIESIVYCVDAMHYLDNEDLMDSEVYEELLDLTSGVSSVEDLDDYEKETAIKLYLRLFLSSEATVFTAQFLFSAIVSLLYIIFAIACLVVAVIDFVLFVMGRESKKLWSVTLCMFAAIPVFNIITGFGIMIAYGGFNNGSLSGGSIVLIVLSLIVLSAFAFEKFFLSGKKVTIDVKEIIKRSLAVLASLLLMLSVIFPVATYGVKTTFSGSSNSTRAYRDLDVSFFDVYAISEDQIEECKNSGKNEIVSLIEGYKSVTKRNFQKGLSSVDSEVLLGYFTYFGGHNFAWLISFVSVFALIASIAGAILLWQNIHAIISDKSPRSKLTVPVKIVGVLMAAITLALMIVFIAIVAHNIDYVKLEGAKTSISIGAGSILALVFSIFAASVPLGKNVKIEEAKQAYIEIQQ